MIRFQRPELPPTAEIDRYLDLSREERWFSNSGPCWRLLRERLAERVGAYCTPVASGTLGLMVALAATGRTAGEAVMPAFTFVATAQAAMWAGLRPRLHDIDPDHWHLCPNRLEAALRGGHAAVAIAVSAFGTPPPPEARERWQRACSEAGVPLLVDSAAGFGAIAEDDLPIGAQGDVEIVSFHATKPFAVGEGGAIFTKSRDLHSRIERAINFGFQPDHSIALGHGLNAKMSELHAATALAVLDRYDDILASRRRAARTLRERSGGDLAWQMGSKRSTWQFLPVAFATPEQRRTALEACRDKIETRVYYQPLDRLLPVEAALIGDELATTADLHDRILCLPMANDLDASEIDSIATLLAAG